MFPVVFHPVAPPKSIALDSGKKKKGKERREKTTDILSIKTLEDTSLTHGKVDFVLYAVFLLEPKPFIDVSVITRFNEYSQVLQFK